MVLFELMQSSLSPQFCCASACACAFRLQVHRIEALKAFGANGWRTAHNPHAPALLDAADRTGFLMW